MVWIYDTHARTLYMAPQHVAGNFLHWLPGGSGHTFLYRPVLPQGPGAPFDGGTWNPGLWLVDAATGEHRNIAIGVPSVDLIDAVPSPDGRRIIYSTTAGLGQGSAVFLMKRDGSERRRLFALEGAEARAIAGLFRWSPDGAHIAYERLSDSVIPFLPAGLWLMNAQGTEQRWLADVDGGHGFRPVWSPDSRSIACVVRTNVDDHLADTQAQALQSAIGVVEVQSRRFWLAASPAQTQVQWNINPTWTADSASITFTALNPLNRIVGSTPRYWSAQIDGHHTLPVLKPLTQPLQHIIALS
ncbi:MAG: PD40 domain-containing protein [Ktedonobacteraceae bacterium]|nr:PD40 domain-containing protein [Ktedonobacteraceae bacterium]